MSQEALSTISEFTKLPKTDEKAEIERQYVEEEIGNFEFLVKAQIYLDGITRPKR